MVQTNLHLFFTTYVFFMVLLHPVLSKYVDILFLSCITLIAGSYIGFVNPTRYAFEVNGWVYDVSGWLRFFTVDMLHIVLFCICLFFVQPYEGWRVVTALSILLAYVMIVDVNEIYKSDTYALAGIMVVVTAVYYCLRTQAPGLF